MSTYPAKLTSQTKNVGHTVAEAAGGAIAPDTKAVWGPFAVPTPSALTITAIKLYCYVTSGSANARAIIYMDNGSDIPTTLLGQSDEVAVTNTSAGWITFPFPAPIVVPAAMSIHIGFHNGGSVSVWFHELFSSGVFDRNTAADVYLGGASDPFGAPTTYAGKDGSVYAVGTATLELNLALGREGQPRVRLGSREKEAAKAGQRGTIVIESLHHGSGQHIARDPMMYEFADGMFADEPGIVKTRGTIATAYTLGTAQDFLSGRSRGAVVMKPSDWDEGDILTITPTQIYAGGTAKLSPATNGHFTGSVDRLGKYLYFGQEFYPNARHFSTWAGSLDSATVTYSNNAGFNASFVAAQSEKLWAARKWQDGSALKIGLAWTDIENASVFTSEYGLGVSGFDMLHGLGIIGPHAVAAISHGAMESASLVAVDTTGSFTDLLRNLPPCYSFTPFLGGQLLWLMGRPRALWMSDVTSFRDVAVDGLSGAYSQAGIPTWELVFNADAGVAATTKGREIYHAVYGTFTKRDGNAVAGSALMHSILTAEGLQTHVVATPESADELENAHILGMMLLPDMSSGVINQPQKPRRLYFATAEPNTSNASQADTKLHRMDVWDGTVEPGTFDTDVKFLRTSRYVGDSWTTKQGELLRGYITKLPADSSAIVRVYLDGDATETYNFSVNTIGPFAQALPSNVIGRDVALDMETNANGSVVIEFPWSLDYFAVPDQKDIVQLPVLAGRDQGTPTGTLTDKTRAEVLGILEGLCASKERWTLSWWDGTPDWDVMPLSYEATEIEPAHVEGAGAAVAWLALQRL